MSAYTLLNSSISPRQATVSVHKMLDCQLVNCSSSSKAINGLFGISVWRGLTVLYHHTQSISLGLVNQFRLI